MNAISDYPNKISNEKKQFFVIALLITAITLTHYTMSHSVIYLHDISRRLYYLPIILAGLWFGKRGGIYSAGVITILYFPHALFAWYGKHPRYLDNLIEIVFFNAVGFLIGSYMEKKNQQQLQAEHNALELEQAYQQLKNNSERIAQLEENIRFADRLSILGELAASLAHEVRNPLGSIQGAAEILKKKFSAQSDEAEFVKIQLNEIQRLNNVVENYLSLAKKESADFTFVPLTDIVNDTIDLVRLSARNKQINIQMLAPEDSIFVYGITLQIQQVILNLTLNGIQAVQAGGTVEFTISTDEKSALLEIKDNGPGVSAEDEDKLFDAFFTSKKEGTGLGLTIVKRIIQKHQGKVWFESNEAGTTFFVQLPLAEQ